MKKSSSHVRLKPYLQAAIFGVAFYLLIGLAIFVVKPVAEDIKPTRSLIEGHLVVARGGLRHSGFVTIGGTPINLTTDLIGSDTGSGALRGISNNSYVHAESVIFPTLFRNKLIVIKIRDDQGGIIYERNVNWLIDTWISSSLGLGALIGFLIAGIAYFFFQHKFESKPIKD